MLIAINVAVEVSAVRRNDCSWGRWPRFRRWIL